MQVSRRWRLFVREEPGISHAVVKTDGDSERLLRNFSLESLRSLKCKSFVGHDRLRDAPCRALLARTPSLTELSLLFISTDAVAPQLAALKHLKTLTASGAPFTDGACRAIAQLSQLTRLHLHSFDTRSAVADLPPSLTRLSLSGTPLSEANVARISVLSRLTELTLVCSASTLDFLRGPLQQSLTHLTVGTVLLPCTVPDLPRLVSADMGCADALDCVSMVRSAPGLEELWVRRCGPQHLEALAGCRRLRNLGLRSPLDTADAHLLARLAPLDSLTLTDIDEMALPVVACCQPSLLNLSVSVCGRVSPRSLECLRPLARLRSLRVAASSRVGRSVSPRAAFGWITSRSLPVLRRLRISLTGALFTSEAMAEVAPHVPVLYWNETLVRAPVGVWV